MSARTKARIDQLLVERGLAESREKAQALILAGEVLVEGQKSDKPGRAVDADARIEVLARLPYVSRGGVKLAAALDHWGIPIAGRTCLDVGASTGGFTDCLLQHGAARVWAVDVGHGQLDWKLRNDPRVTVREGVNARYLTSADFDARFDLAVCDASFISATLLIPAIVPLLKGQPLPDGRGSAIASSGSERGSMIVLIKPQFEAGRGEVGKGGIVRDPAVQHAACGRVRACVADLGFHSDIIESPILGAEGNREFLLYARRND